MQSAEDHSWLLAAQMVLFLIGCTGLYVFVYWQNGGRSAFRESKEEKEARWRLVFAAGLPEVERSDAMLLSSLAQKCDKALRRLIESEDLDLSHQQLDLSHAEALAALVRCNTALGSLDLAHNALDAASLKAIFDGVAASNLQSLDLSGNALYGGEAGEALRSLVLCCPRLSRLVVTNNSLGDDGVRELSRALSNSACALTKVSLARTGLGDGGAYALSAALEANKSLTSVSIWGNDSMSASARAALHRAWGSRKGTLYLGEED
ncbi:hypothetical protein AB1Y20_010220 [Prymnesium parvum]|uniref:Uncharacterized protein n=1 Tax=Prymnesium parvum TaxID=97485 RepID=A0AB34K6T6_PRYPA